MKMIVIFAKYPEPGAVKTRLGKHVGDAHAAELYRLFVDQTLSIVRNSEAEQVLVAVTPKQKLAAFQGEFSLGEFRCFAQQGKDLGERLLHAFGVARELGANQTLIIGSDSPTLPSEYLEQAYQGLKHSELVLGPATDGGYYLIGMKRAESGLFRNMVWSTASVLQNTLKRAHELQLSYSLLPEWYDVDDVENLRRAAAEDKSGKILAFLRANLQMLL